MKFERNGLTEDIFDFKEELGTLTFLGLKNETRIENEDDVVKRRTYSLLSTAKQQIITVGISTEVHAQEISIPRDTEVTLVHPVLGVMSAPGEGRYNSAELIEYYTADDIIPAVGGSAPTKPTQPVNGDKADKK